MAAPLPQFQLDFLAKIQRILTEGSFVATYKFALLHALADLAVLKGDQGDETLTLTTNEIAEKFAEVYWRQVAPYPVPDSSPTTLRQNTGRTAAVIRIIHEARVEHGESLATGQCAALGASRPRRWRLLQWGSR